MFNPKQANKIAKKIFGSDQDNIFAVMYRPEEAIHLGHAFKNGMNFYGISQITEGQKDKLLLTIEEVYNAIEDCKANSFFYSFHPDMRIRFVEKFGTSTDVFKDPETGIFYSELDTIYGNYDIPKDVQARLVIHKMGNENIYWNHFFTTEGARHFCKSLMTKEELDYFEKALQKNINSAKKAAQYTVATIENPIVVDLFGTDDLSYSRSLPNKEAAFDLLNEIEKKGHYITRQEMYSDI